MSSLPFWPLKGKAHLKQQLADRVDPDVTQLPQSAVARLSLAEKAEGRELILVTASHRKYAG